MNREKSDRSRGDERNFLFLLLYIGIDIDNFVDFLGFLDYYSPREKELTT